MSERFDRLLDGDEPWPPGLAALRDAARAPARAGELAGEEAAVAAFRAAQPARRRRTLGRLLTVKVAAVATVLAGGGLAVAAATGNLPAPLAPPDDRPTATSPAGSPGRPVPPAGPAPAEIDLCRRYRDLPPDEVAAALARPPLQALADRAGGAEEVADFCAGVPSVVPSDAASVPPGPTPSAPVPSGPSAPAPSGATPSPPSGPGHGNGPKPSKSPKIKKTPPGHQSPGPPSPPGPPGPPGPPA